MDLGEVLLTRIDPSGPSLISLVGGGGKTTLLAALAQAGQARGWTVMTGTTTRMYVHQTITLPGFMGGEVIADKLGYPAYFVAIRRVGRGRYEATFELLAPTGATRVEGELTEVFARRVERQIREAPADWPWSHKRWRMARD